MSAPLMFRSVVVRAAFFSLVAVALNTMIPRLPISIFVNIVCLIYLYHEAEKSVKANVSGFDPVVASETMVAFGVLSLVMGLASIILAVMLDRISLGAVQKGDLLSFLPFVEGLLTAGFAPASAMLLRIRVAELEADHDTIGDLTGLTRATADLTNQMKSANAAVEALKSGATSAGAATVGLATSMKGEADKWGLALQEGQAHVKTFGEAARIGSGEVSDLASATASLKSATGEVTTLLDELSRLIVAVERFVEPRSRKP